mmetsp:Transcript_14893/g.40918  ORF Transcript_14893/g.40918 Transcript_14893/m.40918 type:complete len:382 (+) Transcript_14893:75-1220(+)
MTVERFITPMNYRVDPDGAPARSSGAACGCSTVVAMSRHLDRERRGSEAPPPAAAASHPADGPAAAAAAAAAAVAVAAPGAPAVTVVTAGSMLVPAAGTSITTSAAGRITANPVAALAPGRRFMAGSVAVPAPGASVTMSVAGHFTACSVPVPAAGAGVTTSAAGRFTTCSVPVPAAGASVTSAAGHFTMCSVAVPAAAASSSTSAARCMGAGPLTGGACSTPPWLDGVHGFVRAPSCDLHGPPVLQCGEASSSAARPRGLLLGTAGLPGCEAKPSDAAVSTPPTRARVGQAPPVRVRRASEGASTSGVTCVLMPSQPCQAVVTPCLRDLRVADPDARAVAAAQLPPSAPTVGGALGVGAASTLRVPAGDSAKAGRRRFLV